MQTHFGRIARDTPFTAEQLELIVGSLLGDGTLLRTTAGYCFRAHHGLAQRALVDWKYVRLRTFVRTGPRSCGSGYYFRTVSHPRLAELRAAFYDGSRKIVPRALLKEFLSPFALAVWIMDDGAADGRQLRINSQSFTVQECEDLARLLWEEFELTFSLNTDKEMPRLRCSADSMSKLRELVGPYLLPEMRYKLPG